MKLSVIIPVYNVAPYLRECLSSVVKATEQLEKIVGVGQRTGSPLVEVICVDDGSTDGSGEILDEYKDQLEKIPLSNSNYSLQLSILHQPNRGVSAARNVAIEAATGEWVLCIDADDTVEPDWIANLLKHAADDVDWVRADAQYCFQGIGRASDRTYRTFLRDGWCVLSLVRRALVGETRFREGMRFKEDVVFFTELALKRPRIAWVKEKGYHYRPRAGSAIQRPIGADDSVRFCEEVLRLGLPRADAGRAIGFDLVLWVRGRDWSTPYDPATCPVLALWRREMAAGRLRTEDVRWWWRPGLRHWLGTGDLNWLVRTRDWRVRLEVAWRRLRGLEA